ncbi:MAG: SRPBCC family protein [Pseudobdellovibrio sp.]
MKLHIERNISINKSTAEVYAIISDLGQWNTWSPWVRIEPTVKTLVTGKAQQVGQYLTWDGEVIGSGKMTLAELTPNQIVKNKLEFLAPWKSVSNVTFTIDDVGFGQTKVTWIMEGNIPFFMIFFKKMMTAFMSYDFDRGLKMLKEYAETGKVLSESVYKGQLPQSGFQVVGKKTSCTISDMPQRMQADFVHMTELMKKGEFTPPNKAGAFYNKFDIPKGVCEYTAAYFYDSGQYVKAPPDFSIQKYSEHKALVVDHLGAYKNLGNPWSMAMAYLRGKKMKARKDIPVYEIYITMPDGRAEKDIHTQIFMPIK